MSVHWTHNLPKHQLLNVRRIALSVWILKDLMNFRQLCHLTVIIEEQNSKTHSIFGLSEIWSEFRPSIAIICRNAIQNSLGPKMDWVSFGKLLINCISTSKTRSSAIAVGPRDAAALCQLKSRQLLHNCTKNLTRKGLQYVSDLECNSRSWRSALCFSYIFDGSPRPTVWYVTTME